MPCQQHLSTGNMHPMGTHHHHGGSAAVHGSAGVEVNKMQLAEEKLATSKQQVSNGGVELHKRVETEHVREEIPCRREEVTVERRPLTGADHMHATSLDKHALEARDDHIRVPLMREEVVAQKVVVPTEEIVVRKTVHTDNKPLETDLRSEYVDTQRLATNTTVGHDSRDLNRDGHVSMGEKAAATGLGQTNTGLHDSRDLNRDGHVSMGEKAAATGLGQTNTGLHDSRDRNRDGHVSMGEKATAATGLGQTNAGLHDPRDLNRDGHVSTGEKAAAMGPGQTNTGLHDSRDLNRDGHVSVGEKAAAATGSDKATGHDARDENHDGHVSLKEKIKDKLHLGRHHETVNPP
jgi:uncharacterized protein (TIGR02271 family)